jgi:hypothetical protein
LPKTSSPSSVHQPSPKRKSLIGFFESQQSWTGVVNDFLLIVTIRRCFPKTPMQVTKVEKKLTTREGRTFLSFACEAMPTALTCRPGLHGLRWPIRPLASAGLRRSFNPNNGEGPSGCLLQLPLRFDGGVLVAIEPYADCVFGPSGVDLGETSGDFLGEAGSVLREPWKLEVFLNRLHKDRPLKGAVEVAAVHDPSIRLHEARERGEKHKTRKETTLPVS